MPTKVFLNVSRASGRPALGALFALALCAVPAGAASPILPGETISVRVDSKLDTLSAKPGDPFELAVIEPYPANDPQYAGARIKGHVESASQAKKGHPASLSLTIDSMSLPSDFTGARFSGHLASAQFALEPLKPNTAASATTKVSVAGGTATASDDTANFSIVPASTATFQIDSTVAPATR